MFLCISGCCLVVSTSEINWLERIVPEINDLLCVEWDVKLYTHTHSLTHDVYLVSFLYLIGLLLYKSSYLLT